MKITIILIKFLFVGALFIISNHQLYLSNQQQMDEFFDRYYNWLSLIFENAMEVSGYVVHSAWIPDQNATLVTTR